MRTRTIAGKPFKMLECFLAENDLKWEVLGRKGLNVQTHQEASPNSEFTHCAIHREALTSRHISSKLNEVMTDILNV